MVKKHLVGPVETRLLRELDDHPLLSVLIDPVDYPSEDDAVKTAVAAAEGGADAVAVGGSIGAQGQLLDYVVKCIKEKTQTPVILFPGNIATLTPHADALFFLSLLNSRNPYWLSQAQMLAAPSIRQMKVEPLPVGYIVVEPGGTVGYVGDANVVPRHKPAIAAAIALAGEYAGSRFIFTDAGSASPLGPVPTTIAKAISSVVNVPYIVAGGIRTPQQAADLVAAGADWIQIGTAVENKDNVQNKTGDFVKAIRKARKG